MSPAQIESDIHAFIARRFPIADSGGAAPVSLLDGGLIDSLGLLEIVTFISERFGTEISDDDFLPEHFETTSSIAALVVRKLAPIR
ncbi:MAG: acyl carrier protein [Burkholderiaceae bacterium]